MNYYYLDLFLTRYCNQSCYYCSIFKEAKSTECDVSKVKYILDHCPSNTAIEMLGGEIGLLKNLDDVFNVIMDHKNVKSVIVESNGLVRKRGVDWLDRVIYIEHPIEDIVGREVIKFYPDLPYYHSRNVIVATEITVKSILENWEYFKDTEFLTDKFKLKVMSLKTHTIESYIPEIERLYKLTNDKQIRMVEAAKNPKMYQAQKTLCKLNAPYPYIDLDENLIGHCAAYHGVTEKVPFTLDNFKLLPTGKLFTNCEYCKECYIFDSIGRKSKARLLLKSGRGEYENRSYE